MFPLGEEFGKMVGEFRALVLGAAAPSGERRTGIGRRIHGRYRIGADI